MDTLEELRGEINEIDEKLADLFLKRMDAVQRVANFKKKNQLPIFHKERENEIIEKYTAGISDDRFRKYTVSFFLGLMELSREYQHEVIGVLEVGYQGIEGSFSEQAMLDYFSKGIKSSNYPDFRDVFLALEAKKIQYGVLPLENTSTGGIGEVYDLLKDFNFYITGEISVEIEHCLLGTKGASLGDIREIYSHPQAFQQSSDFLRSYPDWKLIPCKNTAHSARMIKQKNSKALAAIGSHKAAQLYDLNVLVPGINNNQKNITRFIVIGRDLEVNQECNKISIVMSVPHKPGALYNVLRCLAENKINMMKIESRPILNRSWEYFFYIDFAGNINEPVIQEALEYLSKNSGRFQLLGNYVSHNRR